MTGGPPRRRGTVSLAVCLILYGGLLVSFNSFTAGGADSSGYLNAARLLAQGRDPGRRASLPRRELRAASAVPERSLIVSMQMSGALKYYTNLPIARWDAIRPERFPELRHAVEERGFRWYALLWPFEEADFRRNLPGSWERIATVRDIGLWRLQ
jgi:hypothetical protein